MCVGEVEILYKERQWVPWYWWLFAIAFAALLGAQMGNNRGIAYFIGAFAISAALLGWFLYSLSSTEIAVERDADGTRWLVIGESNLPNTVVSRSMAVPYSAKQSALGPQLDPAAYLVHHSWVAEMVLLVLDDPEDPTPYWLVSSKNPEALLKAFVG
ncbi:hypothetical protein CAQUA_04970 [Corynebacterium aquatimens]|nr:hypothetical protein CAQUA_04970 [Corynebacterium aquatimens]